MLHYVVNNIKVMVQCFVIFIHTAQDQINSLIRYYMSQTNPNIVHPGGEPHTSCFLLLTFKYVAWVRANFQAAIRHAKNHKIKTHVCYDEYKQKLPRPVLHSLHVSNIELNEKDCILRYINFCNSFPRQHFFKMKHTLQDD